jgi:hypothetical protein
MIHAHDCSKMNAKAPLERKGTFHKVFKSKFMFDGEAKSVETFCLLVIFQPKKKNHVKCNLDNSAEF